MIREAELLAGFDPMAASEEAEVRLLVILVVVEDGDDPELGCRRGCSCQPGRTRQAKAQGSGEATATHVGVAGVVEVASELYGERERSVGKLKGCGKKKKLTF